METNLTDIWDILKANFYWHLNRSIYIYTVVYQSLFHTKCQYKHIMDCKNMFQTWFKHVEHCKTLCVPGKFSLRRTQPSLSLTLPSSPDQFTTRRKRLATTRGGAHPALAPGAAPAPDRNCNKLLYSARFVVYINNQLMDMIDMITNLINLLSNYCGLWV